MSFLFCSSSVIIFHHHDILTHNKLLKIDILPLTMSLFSAPLTPNCNLQMCFIQALPQQVTQSLLQPLTVWYNYNSIRYNTTLFSVDADFFFFFFASNHSKYTQQIITDTIRLRQETHHTKNTVACPLDTRWQMVFTDIINSSPLCRSSLAH